jgi:hypothetical protein
MQIKAINEKMSILLELLGTVFLELLNEIEPLQVLVMFQVHIFASDAIFCYLPAEMVGTMARLLLVILLCG